jgi:broad specificity phosphatase PhoE
MIEERGFSVENVEIYASPFVRTMQTAKEIA